MKKVLFVCTGNSCRSVMAEQIFNSLVPPGEARASSAGVSAGDGFPASPETLKLLSEAGIDGSGHKSRRLTAAMVREADYVFAMEAMQREWILRLAPEAEEKVRLLTEYAGAQGFGHRDVPDPIRMTDAFYRNVYGVIQNCVENIARAIRTGGARSV